MANDIITVGELTRQIKRTLETGFPRMWLRAELSGVQFHRSGHLYLTLKDPSAQISGVMWRSKIGKLDFRPQDGAEVLAFGRITVYEKGGRYQFDIETMQPAGRGALALEFEKLKNRLAADGLFDPDHKQAIPKFPKRIGIVTSPSGAAVRDIVATLKRRGFNLELVIAAAMVQGDGAAEDVALAIKKLEELDPPVDTIIVARGGGSLEDLWAFNEEASVRAVYNCPIPIISGVGHETDTTLIDFVSDLRAPTPTAAAEHATVDRNELRSLVHQFGTRLGRGIQGWLEALRLRVEQGAGGYGLRRIPDSINLLGQQVDDFDLRMKRSIEYRFERTSSNIEKQSSRLRTLSPKSVLGRGYSLALKDGVLIKSSTQLKQNDEITLILGEGETIANVKSTSRKSRFDGLSKKESDDARE